MGSNVIWDWNGTLINDGELCVSIVNELLLELSIPSVSLQFYRENFQFPVRSYYEKIGFPKDNRIHERISGNLSGATVNPGVHAICSRTR